MSEKDSIDLKSLASSFKKFVALKEAEVKLRRLEIMLHENFPSSLLASKSSPQKAFDDFYDDFANGI